MDKEHINITLASAKQVYEELIRLTSLAELERCEFGSGTKREQVEELLKKFNASANSIQRTFSEHISGSSEAPILNIPAAHRAFYNDAVVSHGKCLQLAYFEIIDMGMLVDRKPEVMTRHAHYRFMEIYRAFTTFPDVMRAETLSCIMATRLLVETLYSEVLPAK